jgi:hypothetical protein
MHSSYVLVLLSLLACQGSDETSDTGSGEDGTADTDDAQGESGEGGGTDEGGEPGGGDAEPPDWSGVWAVNLTLNYTCTQDFVDTPRADVDGETQTVMLQLSGPPNNLYATTPGTDSSWSMAGSGDEDGITLGGSLRMEVDGDVIDYDSNLTIHAPDVISSEEVHGTIFGSFSANSGWWECEFKDEPSTVILTQ